MCHCLLTAEADKSSAALKYFKVSKRARLKEIFLEKTIVDVKEFAAKRQAIDAYLGI